MSNYTFSFEEIVEYAEILGYKHRSEKSRAFDYTKTYWRSPWDGKLMMVLYEGERRIVGNRKTPEVCWITIKEDGLIGSVPSRYFRKFFEPMMGFGFDDNARRQIAETLRHKEDIRNG